jgi:uncharacterized protein DUF6289
MNRARRMFGTKSLFLTVALGFAAVAILLMSIQPAMAIVIGGPSICTYYSSANHHTVVGARGTGCCGEVISWGVITQYYTCERLYCLDVLCPN